MPSNSELRRAFYELEKAYRPYFDLFVANQDKYYTEFKGGVTIDGYLNAGPDILMLGYNPAHGKYREYSYSNDHLVNQGERPFGFSEWGSVRQNGHWWELNKPVNNSYPANMIEFLYSYVEASGKESEHGTNVKPAWAKEIENKIMMLNLYPFGTENQDKLISLFTKLCKEPNLPKDISFESEWKIRRHFVYMLHQFIEQYVKPKCIVCLGKQTISDYTYGEDKEYEDEKGLYYSDTYTNVIGISRSGIWTSRAQKAGKMAFEIVQKSKSK